MTPITLSKSQFGATAAGKKAGASYPSYLSYVARHRAAKVAQQNADPFAPTSPQDINSVIGKYTAGYGAPQSDAQLQTSASAQLDPIIAAITGNIQKQAGVASGAIGANSAALAKQLAGIDYGAPYAGAQHDQAAVDAALQQSLNGGGAALAGDLKNRLGMIGDPSVGATADALGARGTAIGTNQLASGSTNMGALIANAAAAKEYGVKQPGIAQLAGLEDIAKTNQDATSKIGDATSQVEQLLPQVVQSLRSERDSNQNNKTSLAAQLYQVLTGQNVTKATAKAGLQNTAFDNGIAQENANTAAYKATTAAKTAQAKATAATKPKPLSSSALSKLTTMAHDFYNGVPAQHRYDSKTGAWVPVPGTGSNAVAWKDALAQLVAAGAPPEKAQELLIAQGWQPGEGGRPKSKAQKKTAAAVKAGVGVPKLTGPLAGLGG